jgi:hypothetical protein
MGTLAILQAPDTNASCRHDLQALSMGLSIRAAVAFGIKQLAG